MTDIISSFRDSPVHVYYMCTVLVECIAARYIAHMVDIIIVAVHFAGNVSVVV